MSETFRDDSGTFLNTGGNRTGEDQRREVREGVIGDILWSYIADKDGKRFKGTIVDESESGLCILTLTPIKAGSRLRIYGRSRVAIRDATVIWCKKRSTEIYKSGLSLGE
jgi:hypothetical protein